MPAMAEDKAGIRVAATAEPTAPVSGAAGDDVCANFGTEFNAPTAAYVSSICDLIEPSAGELRADGAGELVVGFRLVDISCGGDVRTGPGTDGCRMAADGGITTAADGGSATEAADGGCNTGEITLDKSVEGLDGTGFLAAIGGAAAAGTAIAMAVGLAGCCGNACPAAIRD